MKGTKDNSEAVVVHTETQVSTPATLLELAIKNNIDIDKLERLMAMKKEWDAQEAKKAFFDALAKFQSICPPIIKDDAVNFTTTKGRTHYRFANLGTIEAIIKGPMYECGLSKMFKTKEEGKKLIITCIISHVSGHSEENTMTAEMDDSGNKNTIQQRGSTQTYLMRYTLIGALGLSTADEDNDGGTGPEKNESSRGEDRGPSPTKWLDEGTPEWEEHVVKPINEGKPGAEVLEAVEKLYRVNKKQREAIPQMKPAAAATPAAPQKKMAPKKNKLTKEDHINWKLAVEQGKTKAQMTDDEKAYNNCVEKLKSGEVALSVVEGIYTLDPEVKTFFESIAKKK